MKDFHKKEAPLLGMQGSGGGLGFLAGLRSLGEDNSVDTLDIFGDNTGLALYQFDGNTNSKDSSSKNATGSTNFGYSSTYKYGTQSGEFTNNTSVNLPTITGSDPVTISMWCQFDGTWTSPNGYRILMNTAIGGTRISMGLVNYGSWPTGICLMFGGTTHYSCFSDFMNAGGSSDWKHIVWTFGTTATNSKFYARLWVDGHRVYLHSNGGNHGGSGNWTIGSNGINGEYWDGRIDQVRVLQRTVNDQDVLKLYYESTTPEEVFQDNSLKLYYDFSNTSCYSGSGTTVNNIAPNGTPFNGTISGGSVTGSGDAKYVDLDGVNDYITVADDINSNMTNKYVTLEAWAWCDGNSGGGSSDGIRSIISCQSDAAGTTGVSMSYDYRGSGTHGGNQGGRGIHYQLGKSNLGWTTTGNHGNTSYVPPENEWVHLAITYDGQRKRVYINGRFVSAESDYDDHVMAGGQTIKYANTTWRIGRQPDGSGGGRHFNGRVAVARIYDAALSGAQIAQHYSLERRRFGFTSSGEGTQESPFTSIDQADEKNVDEGLYYFQYGGTTQQLYVGMVGGARHILVASNNASSTTIPGGTGRLNAAYRVNRNGTTGHLGTPDPDSDYLIGSIVDSISDFRQVTLLGWGRNSTNGTYTWAAKRFGEYAECSMGSNNLTTQISYHKVDYWIFGQLHGSATAWGGDGIAMDSGLNANSNQTTIGMFAANGTADPSNGCYMGHGSNEGNYEGWYTGGVDNSNSQGQNCQGYSTWVR